MKSVSKTTRWFRTKSGSPRERRSFIHYHYLDMVPKGRDEGDRGPFWVRRHDEHDR
jgi:predicted dithiol-disulfide oxidoreductase (DUF899 family)